MLDIFSLASFQEFDERKYCSRWELTTVCGPVMLLLSFVCFAIKTSDVSANDYASI